MSPWAINIEHPWVQTSRDPRTGKELTPYKVDDLRERAMNLCEYEITHANFGLSFLDLMHLDLATFEEIEERVHEIAREQQKSMEKLSGASKEAKSNLLVSNKK